MPCTTLYRVDSQWKKIFLRICTFHDILRIKYFLYGKKFFVGGNNFFWGGYQKIFFRISPNQVDLCTFHGILRIKFFCGGVTTFFCWGGNNFFSCFVATLTQFISKTIVLTGFIPETFL